MAILPLFDWSDVTRCCKHTRTRLHVLWVQENTAFPRAAGVHAHIAVKMVEKHENTCWAWSTFDANPKMAHSTHLDLREGNHLISKPSGPLEWHSCAPPSSQSHQRCCANCVCSAVLGLHAIWTAWDSDPENVNGIISGFCTQTESNTDSVLSHPKKTHKLNFSLILSTSVQLVCLNF